MTKTNTLQLNIWVWSMGLLFFSPQLQLNDNPDMRNKILGASVFMTIWITMCLINHLVFSISEPEYLMAYGYIVGSIGSLAWYAIEEFPNK